MTSNQTYIRWFEEKRPVKGLLPGINGQYTQNEVVDWLTAPIDADLQRLLEFFNNYGDQLNPLTAANEYLDYAAAFCGFTGEYWDRDWPIEAKRQLLSRAFSVIWPFKGTATALSFVLDSFRILHIIQQGESFIIGRNVVGDPLGSIAWDYKIILPDYYFQTPTARLAERLDFLFGPCWCTKEIIYDNEFFRTLTVLGFEDDWGFNFFSTDVSQAEALSTVDL